MDNWDDLRFVIALARYGSMANAARHLRTNTATVSRRIKRLNESAHTALFQKGATEWELTAEGRRLYEIAASFGEELDTFHSATHESDLSFQTVRVTGLEFLNDRILSNTIDVFHANHPNITLELSATDRNVSLAYGEADIALRLSRPNEGRLMTRRIANVNMGAFARAGQHSSDWIGLPYELDWTPEMKFGASFFGRPPAFRMSSFSSILNGMERTGLSGIAPHFMAAPFQKLEMLHAPKDACVREVWMLVHETRKADAGVRHTCKWIEESVAKALNS